MKKGKKKFNVSNKLAYTLIVMLLIVLLGVGVYALSPGVKPNPGHWINETSPPVGCVAGQALSWTGSAWTCATAVTYPTEIKETTGGYHDGNFGGYSGMQSWIQANGCSGYHVCQTWEMVYATGNLESSSFCGDGSCTGWINSGVVSFGNSNNPY